MGRISTSADPLIEILDLCEQALTAVSLSDDGFLQRRQSDNATQLRPQKRAIVAPHLILVQGGLAGNIRHPNAR